LSIGVWSYSRGTYASFTDSSAISAVSPDPAALRAYQEWEARLHATLSAGRETEAINAVTELTGDTGGQRVFSWIRQVSGAGYPAIWLPSWPRRA